MNWIVECFQGIRYHFGRLFFPVMEPVYILAENLRPEVRRHFEQAVRNLEKHNISGGLMNLNMVLSLKPNHFLARVYRGRIYLRENQFRLASDDFVLANDINEYRFTHYNIHQEYLDAVHEGARRCKEDMDDMDTAVCQDELDSLLEVDGECILDDDELFLLEEDLELTDEEREKFQEMGPIGSNETTDVDDLIKQLTTRSN